jgi:hypothetical protein
MPFLEQWNMEIKRFFHFRIFSEILTPACKPERPFLLQYRGQETEDTHRQIQRNENNLNRQVAKYARKNNMKN